MRLTILHVTDVIATRMNPIQRVETQLGTWFTWPNYIVRYLFRLSPNSTSCKVLCSFFTVMKFRVMFCVV